MNKNIKSYADSIYEQALMNSAASLNAEKREYLRELAAKQPTNLPLGGSQVQAILHLHLEHVERCVAARLKSYRTAFAEAAQLPSEQELTDILNDFKSVRETQAKQASAAIVNFVKTRGFQPQAGSLNSLMEVTGALHDRVLREWKVWRDQVRLLQTTNKVNEDSLQSILGIEEIQSALQLLHPEFQSYGHYFREKKLKEAVAAAFERYENRLNEIRDMCRNRNVKGLAGHALVYKLFNEKILKSPYSRLGGTPPKKEAYSQGLTGILSGGVSWIRNAYTHEKHKLPDPTPAEAVELLFVASYLMRMVNLSKR